MYRAITDFISQVSAASWATAVGQYGGPNTLPPERGCCRVWYLKKMVQVAPTCPVGCLTFSLQFRPLFHPCWISGSCCRLPYLALNVSAGLLSSSALLPSSLWCPALLYPKRCQKCPHAARQLPSPFHPPRAPPHSAVFTATPLPTWQTTQSPWKRFSLSARSVTVQAHLCRLLTGTSLPFQDSPLTSS